MNMKSALVFVLFFVVSVSSLHGQIVAAVESVLTRQSMAWNRGDIDGYMQEYWKSDSLLFTSGGNIERGWEKTREKYKAKYNSPEKMGILKFSNLEVTPLSKTSAWVFGHWELKRAKDAPGGVFTLILRKLPDGWKIVHDHTSMGASKNEK